AALLEGCDLERGRQEGGPGRDQAAEGWQARALLQVQRRSDRRLSVDISARKYQAMARLKEFYEKTVVPKLKQDLGLKNVMEIPRITKITVNMGVGEAVADRKVMDAAVADLTKITGQKPVLCLSKKSIASFKVRENLAIGAKVTLRGERMYEFLDRL